MTVPDWRTITDGEHNWIRTIPTDGLWCNRCGMAAARWGGEDCPGEGAAEEVERRMIARLADVWDQGYLAANNGKDENTNPYRAL